MCGNHFAIMISIHTSDFYFVLRKSGLETKQKTIYAWKQNTPYPKEKCFLVCFKVPTDLMR